jgi:hypothetical protein
VTFTVGNRGAGGSLGGRTAGPADPLGAAAATLLREGRRRLAVVDDSGRLLGLLCLKGTDQATVPMKASAAARNALQPLSQHSQAGCPCRRQ